MTERTLIEQRDYEFQQLHDEAVKAFRAGAKRVEVDPALIIGLHATMEAYREMVYRDAEPRPRPTRGGR